MGLDASVMCNCLWLGRTSVPPVPRDWLQIDEEGYLGLKPEHDLDAVYHKVHEWGRTCCEHPDMKYASEWIANWTGYRRFQQALASVGWHRFPVLHHELPEVNGGLTDASASALALGELDDFRKVRVVGSKLCLVATVTGDVVYEHVAAYDGVFIMDGRSGLDAGLDGSGFFIRDRETGAERFRATRFRQTLLAPDLDMSGPEPGGVVFRDQDTGRTFECRTAVSGGMIPWPDGRMQDDQGRWRFEHPPEFHVEVRDECSSDFDSIVKPLVVVFRAAVEMGNPVRWC